MKLKCCKSLHKLAALLAQYCIVLLFKKHQNKSLLQVVFYLKHCMLVALPLKVLITFKINGQ